MDISEKIFLFNASREAGEREFHPYFFPPTENEGTKADFQGHRLINGPLKIYKQLEEERVDRIGI